MTTQAQPVEPTSEREIDLGIIGDRQLVCVQLFDIARHPSAPVVLVPSCFVAVTGKGPEDSNESGKTSWMASVSLLLGDPEWRMYGAGPAAVAQLLFEPDTAGVAAQRYPAATFGFIAGVFANPDDVLATAHTVWMRISATAPYVQIRHAPGVHLATSNDEEDRHSAAPAIFKSLPSPALGATQYAERLYGPVPRCLAYLTSRGKRRGGPSLLKLETGLFTPAGIGAALIDLTGRAHLLETDEAVRRDLARETAQLTDLEHENENALAQEEQALNAIDQRDKARQNLNQAWDFWQLHYARGLLDVLDKQQELSAAKQDIQPLLDDAKRAVTRAAEGLSALQDTRKVDQDLREADEKNQTATNRLNQALDRERGLRLDITNTQEQIQQAEREAVGAHGTLDDARRAASEARRTTLDAEVRRTAAEAARTSALRDIEKAERGHYGQAGRTVEILTAAGIEAVGLLDGLEIPPNQRARWEARLALYRDAVCIDADQADRATHELAELPGAVLVLRQNSRSARSPAFATPALRPFLHTLAERLHTTTDPIAALDDELGLRILGGFPQPITGRSALLERLHHLVDQAQETLRTTVEAAQRASTAQEDADLLVRRLEHAQRATELRTRRQALETELADFAPELQRLHAVSEQAAQVKEDALVKQKVLVLQRKDAEHQLQAARKTEQNLTEQDDDLSRQLTTLNIDYWMERAGSPDQARTALRLPPDGQQQDPNALPPERRSEISLRELAGRHLQQAIADLGIDLISGAGAPIPAITQAVQLRANQAGEEGSRQFASAEAFERPANAIQEWLGTRADIDRGTRARVTANREEREVGLAAAQQTVADLNQSVRAMQGSITLRLDQALQDIEDALDRLNRGAGLYGAELRRTLTPPASLSDMWRCEITPCWRRTPTGPMLPYDNITNAAQEKLFSIHLVLAALLASPHPRGRVLILDELGDALGYHHRREVLSAIAGTAEQHGISVLGTCQETLIDDAADFYGSLLYFHYPSHTEALNTATRMFGYDENNERVELTLEALLAGRALW
ncbi:hypothetical protein E6W39_06540 [Kitasatospora acidiphila]|uniref:Chromosome segregation ATPase n=1 Tax=Kitasatospora acidiphila TaxID=2567942 RepID=A0A540VZ03_9ACTN|nr:hypothetical protein [Kitasatospora acidiphila]TQF01995.1 hypothetical protein E6W39_06540 [Kitasatospora acidiphila]